MKLYINNLFLLLLALTVVSCVKDPFDEFDEGNWNNERSILSIKFENQVGKEQITRVDDQLGTITLGINTGAVADLSDIKINSLVPLEARNFASLTKSSMDLDTCLPRIKGMAQKEQGRLQPSAILKYEK